MATKAALEVVPGLPVPLIAMPTHRARARGVAQIDRDYGDAFSLCLVDDERLELVERPAVETGSLLRTSSRGPVANAMEVFQADCAAGAFGLRNNRVGYLVALVPPESELAPADRAESAPCVLGPALVQALAPPAIAPAARLDIVAAEMLAVVGS